jgi:hypothetical protein
LRDDERFRNEELIFLTLSEVEFYPVKRVCPVLTLHTAEFGFAFTILIPYAGELRPIVIWAVAAEGHPIEEGFGARIDGASAFLAVGAVSQFALDTLGHRIPLDTLRHERI